MGIMRTKTKLTLEQTQQGVSDEVLVSIEGVEEWKRNVKIKGEKKEALLTLRQKPVTDRFTLIVLSALRCSVNENKQVRSVLTEPKMEMEIPGSSRVKFIIACLYPIIKYKDMMKAQVHVSQVFRYSDTQNIFLKSLRVQDEASQGISFDSFQE
ncbi:hypothetical protein Tco_0134537 [Tanacetum coccineum]